MGDINTYALGLEFQLQAQPAIESINSMVNMATQLQTSLSKASKAFNSGQHVYEYEQVVAVQQEAKLRIDAVTLAEVQYRKALSDGGIQQALSSKAQTEYNERIQELEKVYDSAIESTREFLEANKAFADFTSKDISRLDNRIKKTQQFKKDVVANTEALQKQVQPLKEVGHWMESLSGDAGNLGQVVRKLAGQYGAAGAALFLFGTGMKDVMAMQDAYAKSTFRLMGNQKDLIDSTLRLKSTLGVSTAEAKSAMEAITKVGFSAQKVGREGIDALAAANTKFTIATGVSSMAAARFQREIGILTGSNEAATLQLGEISRAMSSSGLSADQAESMVSGMTKSLREMSFTMDPKFTAEYAREVIKLSAAFHQAGGSAESVSQQFSKTFQNSRQAMISFAKVGATFDSTAGAAENVNRYLEGVQKTFEQYGGAANVATDILAQALEVDLEFASSLKRMGIDAAAAGKSIGVFNASMTDNANLDKDANEAMQTLNVQLKRLWNSFEAIWANLSKTLIPVLTFLVDKLATLVTWVSELHSSITSVNPVVEYLVNGLLTAGIATVALVGPLSGVVGLFGGMFAKVKAILNPLSKTTQAISLAGKASLGAGAGMKGFLTSLGEGLKALGTPQAMKGAITLGILAVAVGGTLLLMAYAMHKFGLSGKDMLFAAGALVIAAGAMYIMAHAIKALSSAGPKAALAGGILIGVVLALGIATALAGAGIGFMAKGFAELFKSIPDIQTFLVVIGGMVLAMPVLAVGIAILGVSIMASAPFILAGFAMLAGAALIAKAIMPTFIEFGSAVMVINRAMSGIGPDIGDNLVKLAIGMTTFMAALMGIAGAGAVGGIGRIFGMKSPLGQAQEIAAAMSVLAGPASLLAGSLQKLSSIGDVFKPFIDSVLTKKEELKEATKIITEMAEQVSMARKSMGDGSMVSPLGPITFKAEPVKKPLITEDTARKIRDERNQSLMVENTKATNESIKKVAEKLDNETVKELLNFLKEWLPKLGSNEKDSGGLASSVNQWM